MQKLAETAQSVPHPHKSGVPSNYALILFGMFIFPLILVALFEAKKRKTAAQEWEKSHYEVQYRSSVVFMLGMLAMLLAGAGNLFPGQEYEPSRTCTHKNVDRSDCKSQLPFGRLGRGAQHSQPVSGRRQTSNREPKKLLGLAFCCMIK